MTDMPIDETEVNKIVNATLAILGESRETYDDLRGTLLRSEPVWPGGDWQPHSSGDFAPFIDHTILKPEATDSDIARLCDEAHRMQFASVCVNSGNVNLCVQLLAESEVNVCSVVGFPLGTMATPIKRAETEYAVDNGAREIDMVLNVGALKSGPQGIAFVYNDIRQVVEGAWGNPVKVILETCLLAQEEIITAGVVAVLAGAAFVKTSTGFSKGGATVEDVTLMRRVVGPNIGVKASGGIRDTATAFAMIRAGANRLGTSSGMAIVERDKGELA